MQLSLTCLGGRWMRGEGDKQRHPKGFLMLRWEPHHGRHAPEMGKTEVTPGATDKDDSTAWNAVSTAQPGVTVWTAGAGVPGFKILALPTTGKVAQLRRDLLFLLY